jgi:hypothetical protein
MWLVFSLGIDKLYQSDVVTLGGAGTLNYDAGLDILVRNLSGRDCDIPEN